jgi:Icc-related predicted phosphoesterase
MIIDCIADLHGYYPELEGGDLLIVAGDLTRTYDEQEYLDFYNWMREQNYTKKIVISGNHDTLIEREGQEWMAFEDCGFTYLQDSGTEFNCIDIQDGTMDLVKDGCLSVKITNQKLKIWGSPWTLKFPGMNPECMAFTCDTEKELAKKWALIPDDTDILITHGPYEGTLDSVKQYDFDGNSKIESVGSYTLRRRIFNIRPKLHVCGHIHEAYGKMITKYAQVVVDLEGEDSELIYDKKETICVNCSHVNERYEPVNKPIRVIL